MLGIERHEYVAVAWSFAYFFCVLSSYYILRPVREAMAVGSGPDTIPYLFIGTFVAMLFATPIFGWVASRFPRRQFLPWVYLFFLPGCRFGRGIRVAWPRVLCLAQRVQSVRCLRVLELYGGHLYPRTGPPPFRRNHRGRQYWRVARWHGDQSACNENRLSEPDANFGRRPSDRRVMHRTPARLGAPGARRRDYSDGRKQPAAGR